jgi:hypothetical protein
MTTKDTKPPRFEYGKLLPHFLRSYPDLEAMIDQLTADHPGLMRDVARRMLTEAGA